MNAKLADYSQFLKVRLASLVVFSAVIGYLMAIGSFDFFTHIVKILMLSLAGFLVTGAANGINQIVEKDSDKLMDRTKNRPLPTSRMTVGEAWILVVFCGVVGLGILFWFNVLTGFLGLCSVVLYAFVYTPFKKINSIAVFIGAFPGALPVLIGYAAAANAITFEAMLLFLVQFMWQFPHFWAIAWQHNDDYQKASIKLLPNEDLPTKKTALQTLFYTFTLIPLCLSLTFFGFVGYVSAVVCTVVGLYFLYKAFVLYQKGDKPSARQLMFASFWFLPLVQIINVVDKI